MPFPNPDTQFKPGNPGGGAPKGSKHLATHIQEMLSDETLTPEDLVIGSKPFKGTPMKAIILVAFAKASSGDQKWADWLGKYGYGSKVDVTTDGESLKGEADPAKAAAYAEFLKNK